MASEYSLISGKVFWSAFKASLITGLFVCLNIGYVFYKSRFQTGAVDSFSAALLMLPVGILLLIPGLFIFVYLVGSPLFLLLIKKGRRDIWSYIVAGGLCSGILLGIVPQIFSEKEATKIIFSGFNLFFPGALTGYFFHQQIQKLGF